ncbi:hypothetical protein [Acinetobacter soli]|uniref:Uncharacterized protein n=1 Tax=Acinetobacter soli TaxID=487316 RepID=A0A1P8ENH2_9GAMM|nr:hypothetical protein [Acinetobacter soli]APV37725.1 hypothetical protein BEN76_16895 [Acinetobacter soli]
MFNRDQLKECSKQIAASVHVAQNFMNHMKFKDGRSEDAVKQYDSIVAACRENGTDVNYIIPKAVTDLVDVHFKDSPNAKAQILDAVSRGIEFYRNKHGGSMPAAGLVASAFEAANLIYGGLTSANTDGFYDSAQAKTTDPEIISFYDSVSSGSSSHIADVPALAMVTITMMIANASPLVAYLPNPNGTNTLPLVYVRQVAAVDYGQTRQGDYLDGAKAAAQFFDSVHKFRMATTDAKTFTTIARSMVDVGHSPIGSQRLPCVIGASRLYVGGIYVGSDEYITGKTPKNSNFIQRIDSLVINGQEYKLISGNHNTDTDTFTVVFDKALPAGVDVYVQVVADYQRKENGETVLKAPSSDVDLDYTSVHAYPIRAIYVATIEALTQLANELGVDIRSAFIAIVVAKLMLEQNTRLLKELMERAVGMNFTRIVDLTRGSDMTSAFNSTSQIGAEIFPAVEDSKRRIIENTTHKPDGFDVFCTGSLSTLMKILADDTHFVPTGLTFGLPSEIVRIGSKGTDNYYYVPESAEIVKELDIVEEVNGVDIQSRISEMLIIGRNSQAAKSVCVGHVAVPVITSDVRSKDFEQGVTYMSRQAAQVNDLPRYANQIFKLVVQNLPKSLTNLG